MDQYSYLANADVSAIESLYQQFKENPDSVDESWHNFFKGFEFSNQWNNEGKTASSVSASDEHVRKEIEVVHLIRGIRARGHMAGNVNPLWPERKHNPSLALEDFKLSEADLDTVFEAGIEVLGRPATLREINDTLRKVYIGPIGFEYQYIRDRKIKGWFRRKIEGEYQ